jgi:hypothetical protein
MPMRAVPLPSLARQKPRECGWNANVLTMEGGERGRELFPRCVIGTAHIRWGIINLACFILSHQEKKLNPSLSKEEEEERKAPIAIHPSSNIASNPSQLIYHTCNTRLAQAASYCIKKQHHTYDREEWRH